MGFISSLFRRSEKRRAYAELARLDDHLLRDIGISRSDLHRMASGTRTAHTKGPRAHE
jgi:uncharacterized protein YjiS (DUF1127 family)